MEKLLCVTQNYEWGSINQNSIVAKFCEHHTPDNKGPFAEFWMGCHPNGHSLLESKISLEKHLKDFKLPFLFKFLSVQKALSIQVHPNKSLAEKLNKFYPDIYKDDNHKPEMAVALTTCSLLYGFRSDWQKVLQLYPEIPSFGILQELIVYLVSGIDIDTVYKSIKIRLLNENNNELFLKLNEQHPHDIGVLFALFMNKIILNPGDAISIKANIPHAYLSGDLVECMANSDNVIRAGLTPKYKDVATLLSCVNFETGLPEIIQPVNGIYKSGFREFDIIHKKDIKINFEKCAIIAIINSKSKTYLPGMVFYVYPNTEIKFDDEVEIWAATEH